MSNNKCDQYIDEHKELLVGLMDNELMEEKNEQ